MRYLESLKHSLLPYELSLKCKIGTFNLSINNNWITD